MHIYMAWQKRWRGSDFRQQFWRCAKSPFEQMFTDQLEKLDSLGTGTVEHLLTYPPHTWCRSYFSFNSKCDTVCNNMSESFNGHLVKARQKHIIAMLDFLIVDAMKRIHEKREAASKWFCNVSPSACAKLNKNIERAAMCTIEWNGEKGYEISEGTDRHTVNLDTRSCTYRSWDLTGIPCPHGICALNHSEKVLEDYVDKWYSKEKYLAAYRICLQPVKGRNMWPKTNIPPMLPPKVNRSAGRPKISRRKDPEEPKKSGKLSRRGAIMTCSLCQSKGHNRKGCPSKDTVSAYLSFSIAYQSYANNFPLIHLQDDQTHCLWYVICTDD